MADLRIVDAPEIPTEDITGEEKLPTGGSGNYSISLDSLADYTKTKKDLADNTSVDNKVNGVRQELDAHIEDFLNPHQVTKGQIGLGNVDNTADADKPVSNSTQASIISAVSPKADKTCVDNQLTLKANKVDVYTKSETYTKQESSDLVNDSISTALTPVNTSLDLAKRGIANTFDDSLSYNINERVLLDNGTEVISTITSNTNDPNVNMTGWINPSEDQRVLNDLVAKRGFANYRDAREFGIIPDKTTDWTSAILGAVATLPESSTLYIPQGTLWAATSNPDAVYAAMSSNTTILDDSGYESRYSTPSAERWQASQQIYYKTKDYGAAGRRNGNGLNLRSDYHSYVNFEIDAPFGTGGCKGSVIFRFNNGTDEILQIGANGDSATQGHLGIASYGAYSSGVTALRVGMQSSNAPHSFAFNSAMIGDTSYIFGKRIRKTNPLHLETEAEWQSAGHVTRYSQPSGHTGNFDKIFYYGSSLAYREILDDTGRHRIVTKNSKTLTTTADGEQFGGKLSVLTPTANTLLSESLSGSYYSNVSTGGTLTLTLPKAIKGTYFDFSVDVAQNLVIAPNALDNFSGMVAGKTKTSNTINSKLRVVAISATQWSFVQTGTWTDQA